MVTRNKLIFTLAVASLVLPLPVIGQEEDPCPYDLGGAPGILICGAYGALGDTPDLLPDDLVPPLPEDLLPEGFETPPLPSDGPAPSWAIDYTNGLAVPVENAVAALLFNTFDGFYDGLDSAEELVLWFGHEGFYAYYNTLEDTEEAVDVTGELAFGTYYTSLDTTEQITLGVAQAGLGAFYAYLAHNEAAIEEAPREAIRTLLEAEEMLLHFHALAYQAVYPVQDLVPWGSLPVDSDGAAAEGMDAGGGSGETSTAQEGGLQYSPGNGLNDPQMDWEHLFPKCGENQLGGYLFYADATGHKLNCRPVQATMQLFGGNCDDPCVEWEWDQATGDITVTLHNEATGSPVRGLRLVGDDRALDFLAPSTERLPGKATWVIRDVTENGLDAVVKLITGGSVIKGFEPIDIQYRGANGHEQPDWIAFKVRTDIYDWIRWDGIVLGEKMMGESCSDPCYEERAPSLLNLVLGSKKPTGSDAWTNENQYELNVRLGGDAGEEDDEVPDILSTSVIATHHGDAEQYQRMHFKMLRSGASISGEISLREDRDIVDIDWFYNPGLETFSVHFPDLSFESQDGLKVRFLKDIQRLRFVNVPDVVAAGSGCDQDVVDIWNERAGSADASSSPAQRCVRVDVSTSNTLVEMGAGGGTLELTDLPENTDLRATIGPGSAFKAHLETGSATLKADNADIDDINIPDLTVKRLKSLAITPRIQCNDKYAGNWLNATFTENGYLRGQVDMGETTIDAYVTGLRTLSWHDVDTHAGGYGDKILRATFDPDGSGQIQDVTLKHTQYEKSAGGCFATGQIKGVVDVDAFTASEIRSLAIRVDHPDLKDPRVVDQDLNDDPGIKVEEIRLGIGGSLNIHATIDDRDNEGFWNVDNDADVELDVRRPEEDVYKVNLDMEIDMAPDVYFPWTWSQYSSSHATIHPSEGECTFYGKSAHRGAAGLALGDPRCPDVRYE